MYLREIPIHLARLLDEYNGDEELTDERRVVLEAEMQKLTGRLEEKLDVFATVITTGYSNIDSLKAESKRIDALAKSRLAKVKRLERFTLALIQLSGLTTIDTDNHRLLLGTSQFVAIDNQDTIPQEFMREVPMRLEPNKDEIKRALKSGISIDGTRLDTRSYLIIR